MHLRVAIARDHCESGVVCFHTRAWLDVRRDAARPFSHAATLDLNMHLSFTSCVLRVPNPSSASPCTSAPTSYFPPQTLIILSLQPS